MASCGWPALIFATDGGVLSAWRMCWETDGQRRVAAVPEGPSLHLDGDISALCLSSSSNASSWEGIAATCANSMWYFNAREGLKVRLECFHSSPSRMLRSNVAVASVAEQEAPEVLATCADDGTVRLWRHEEVEDGARDLHMEALAQYKGDAACIGVAFVHADLLACGFANGRLCLLDLGEDGMHAGLQVSAFEEEVMETEPLMVIEAIGPGTLLVGSGSGRMAEVSFQLERRGRGWALGAAQRRSLQPNFGTEDATIGTSSTACGAVCGISLDHPFSSAVRFLVCFAGLEFRIWERASCRGTNAAAIKHTHSWTWPDDEPGPPVVQRAGSQAECLALLASPPLVATFVGVGSAEVGDLVVVTAPSASSLFVYSCTQGVTVRRVSLPVLPPVMRFVQLSPPWAGDGASDDGSSVLLALCSDRFAQLRLSRGGRHAAWLGVPLQLPGGSGSTVSGRTLGGPYGGTPDACLTVARVGNRGGRGCTQGTWVLLVKGDAAITSWSLHTGSAAVVGGSVTEAARLQVGLQDAGNG